MVYLADKYIIQGKMNLIKDLKANHHFWSWVLLIIFRYGQFINKYNLNKFIKNILLLPYYVGNLFIIEGFLHCHFPVSIEMGGGISLFHPYGIMINRNAKIGQNVVMRNNVTIGVKHQNEYASAKIGDGVDIGTGAKIIGSVSIGKNCKIGANAVVLNDFSDNSIIVGIPARSVKKR